MQKRIFKKIESKNNSYDAIESDENPCSKMLKKAKSI